VHPGDLCSAVKALSAHLLGALGIATMKGLNAAGEGGYERITWLAAAARNGR
jgi:hypothetical protein